MEPAATTSSLSEVREDGNMAENSSAASSAVTGKAPTPGNAAETDGPVEKVVTPGAAGGQGGGGGVTGVDSAGIISTKLRDLSLLLGGGQNFGAHSGRGAERRRHMFWETQPVSQFIESTQGGTDGASVDGDGPIDVPKTVAEVRKEPYSLPNDYEWSTCDVSDPKTLDDMYSLLTHNYVEDADNVFRFDYPAPFLQWALQPPGYYPDWHIGVRVKKTKRLVAMITGVPSTVVVNGTPISMAEINFLCVLKKLRAKRLAPVLIREVTRRINLCNIWQAAYTAGIVLPKPIAQARYYHRSLNPKKLIECKFSSLGRNMTMARTIKLYRLPENALIPGIRPMRKEDAPAVTDLLNKYLEQFAVHPHFVPEEVAHIFVPRVDVVYSYVVESAAAAGTGGGCSSGGKGKGGKSAESNGRAKGVESGGGGKGQEISESGPRITDFCSFYNLPSTVLGHDVHNSLKAAYSFYNCANTVPLELLLNDALILAKKEGFDVFNALDVMHNATVLTNLKFGIGDGHLQYYLYNWRIARGELKPSEIGLVLL